MKRALLLLLLVLGAAVTITTGVAATHAPPQNYLALHELPKPTAAGRPQWIRAEHVIGVSDNHDSQQFGNPGFQGVPHCSVERIKFVNVPRTDPNWRGTVKTEEEVAETFEVIREQLRLCGRLDKFVEVRELSGPNLDVRRRRLIRREDVLMVWKHASLTERTHFWLQVKWRDDHGNRSETVLKVLDWRP